MPDWNPAEMIGIKTKGSGSIIVSRTNYRFHMGKKREKYGFSDLTSNHLMSSFLGTPFIDIRVDFNSWLPKNLNINTKKRKAFKLLSKYI